MLEGVLRTWCTERQGLFLFELMPLYLLDELVFDIETVHFLNLLQLLPFLVILLLIRATEFFYQGIGRGRQCFGPSTTSDAFV
jgi:hypothetical protein